MKVILLEKVHNLGGLGETVQVKAGYARNFLVPQGKAIRASKENLAVFEARRAELEKAATETLQAAQTRAQKLDGLELTILARTHENKLFGSVGPREIANAIQEKGITIENREIDMPQGPIHEIGEYAVTVNLHSDVSTTVKVLVEPEE